MRTIASARLGNRAVSRNVTLFLFLLLAMGLAALPASPARAGQIITTFNSTTTTALWSNATKWDNGVPNNTATDTYQAIINSVDSQNVFHYLTMDVNVTVDRFELNGRTTPYPPVGLAVAPGVTLTLTGSQPSDIKSGALWFAGAAIKGGQINVDPNNGSLYLGTYSYSVTPSYPCTLDGVVINGRKDAYSGVFTGADTLLINGASIHCGFNVQGPLYNGTGTLPSPVALKVDEDMTYDGGSMVLNTYYGGDYDLTQLKVGDSRTFTIANGSTVVGISASIRDLSSGGAGGTLVNNGTITAGPSNGPPIASPFRISTSNFTNNSLISLTDSTMSPGGTLIIDSPNWTNSPTGTITAKNSSLTCRGNWSNYGAIIANGGAVDLGGNWTNAGSIEVLRQMTASSGYTQTAGQTWLHTTSAVVSEGTSASAGAVTYSYTGGKLTGSGAVKFWNALSKLSVEGATISPGDTVGTLTVGGILELRSATILDFQLGAPGVVGGSTNDLITITNTLGSVPGSLVLDGTLDVTAMNSFGAGTYRLFNYPSGHLTDNGLDIGIMPDGYTGQIDLSTAGQVNLIVTQVPEPCTLAMLALGGLAMLRRRK